LENKDRPLLLVSNDDGHSSYFLRALVESLCQEYDVCVVAPLEEQSWVGRAMTRRGVLDVIELNDWPCPAWAVSGRPADCVNVGLHHLISRRPTAVVSGMNLGFNVSLPLALGSGTIAAATEGALAGLPAIAFSLALESRDFAKVSGQHGRRDEEGDKITRRAATRALAITQEILSRPQPPYSVHNVNFPPRLTEEAPLTQTELALSEIPSLFAPLEMSPDTRDPETPMTTPRADQISSDESSPPRRYAFSFTSQWNHTHNPERSDLQALKRGEISHTVIRWDKISGS
jgi:5'-nucleotidase